MVRDRDTELNYGLAKNNLREMTEKPKMGGCYKLVASKEAKVGGVAGGGGRRLWGGGGGEGGGCRGDSLKGEEGRSNKEVYKVPKAASVASCLMLRYAIDIHIPFMPNRFSMRFANPPFP